MTTPPNGATPARGHHTVTILNPFGVTVTAPVVLMENMGDGRANVHVESNYHIQEGHDYPATYSVPGKVAKGHYRVSAKVFTPALTYIYMDIFTRAKERR